MGIEEKQTESTRGLDTIASANAREEHEMEYLESASHSKEIPPSGRYLFDIAFAEWQGKSMGVKLTVEIVGDSVKVIYNGIGELSNTEIGEVIDQGLIMKHKSGDWIIGLRPEDRELDEVGGCTGGPAIIDFKHKKYWVC